MPLYDHFHPPVEDDLPWDTLHSGWASNLAIALNQRWLTADFVALEHTHLGPSVEIDVGTFERDHSPAPSLPNGGPVSTLPQVWAPPAPKATIPAVFPDTFEVRVYSKKDGRRLVGAIELVSPANKDRPQERRTFVAKCASYLAQGISVVIIDIVTTRHANLHNELIQFLQSPGANLPEEAHLYATAFRPVLRDEQPQFDVWAEGCAVGAPLPTMPLRLTGDLFVPVELEPTYVETCHQRKLF
jgi:hypothetical protein